MVADTPQQKIDHKAFHCRIVNDFDAINKEESKYEPIPVIRQVDNDMVQRNYLQIKKDVQYIVDSELEKMMEDPGLKHLVITKNTSN
jgi:hypothetical protein